MLLFDAYFFFFFFSRSPTENVSALVTIKCNGGRNTLDYLSVFFFSVAPSTAISLMCYNMQACHGPLCVWQVRMLSNLSRPALKNISLLTDVTEKWSSFQMLLKTNLPSRSTVSNLRRMDLKLPQKSCFNLCFDGLRWLTRSSEKN
jgi:hypothetical protein